jgi:hypothetical protein
MTEGDGIRRNVAYITPLEKQHLRDAIKALNTRVYPPSRDDFRLGIRDDVLFPDVSTYKPAGGVSYWFKQDEIHRATHVHHGPAFLTWHREFCNRFETLLRSVNPNLSLHYWDWTMDPNPLFTSDFMGSASGPVREPWESAGFYKPLVKPDFNRDKTGNCADPPQSLERSVGVSESLSSFNLAEDNRVIYASTYKEMRGILEDIHDKAHPYIGGTIGDPHTAFRDPFVFLLHSNVDRLFAMWQLQDPIKRLNPDLVYGEESCSVAKGRDVGILTPLEPWAGVDARMYDKSCKLSSGAEDGVLPTRPWAPPENEMAVKNSKHISVVTPPLYDTSLTPATGPVRKMHTKEIEAIRPWMLKLVDMESKVPDKIPESKVLEQMPTDVGLFTERIDHIEERLATMESFIRPYERPRLDKKDSTQPQNSDENQTGE